VRDFRSRWFRLLVASGPSGIVCDWKGQRDSFQNDAKLLGRAFAFVYVGSIVDQAISDPISDELRKDVVSDMSVRLTRGKLPSIGVSPKQ
jgi:hypothetical protein